MDIYLVPTHKGYELYSSESMKEEPEEKGLVKRVKRLYEKLVTNHEKVLRGANKTKEGITLNYSADMPEAWGKSIYRSIMRKEKKKNLAYCAAYSLLTPVTFVVAPFVPFINWGIAAFFAYKCATHYKALHGARKIGKVQTYKADKKISELENVLIEHKDYVKLAEKAEELECKGLAKMYRKRRKKKIKKAKII